MVRPNGPDEPATNRLPAAGRADPGGASDRSGADHRWRSLDRRSLLKASGVLAFGALGTAATAGSAAAVSVSSGPGYDIWTVTDQQTYDLSDGETLSNILIDQSASGARLTIRARNKSGWTVKNVGFVGVGKYGTKEFQFQVSCPSGGHGLIENVWMNGKARDGQSATSLGGIYIRASHAGQIDVRHTYIEGFGNNACYASAVGKDSGQNGTTTLENCYHRDNTVSQFRIGAPGSYVRNCVGVVDDPKGLRGTYPYFNDQNARGIWGKHFPNQNVENSSFYVSPNDVNPGGAFCARYISGRSHGSEADLDASNCNVNSNVPTLKQTTSNAHVNFTNLGHNPTVTVIQGGGVPLSPKMAALGQRQMPPELPGASGTTSTSSSSSSTTLDHTLQVDGTNASRTDYTFTVSGDLAEDAALGSLGTGDTISGSTATGFVNGGTDGYSFSGSITDMQVDGDAVVKVDGSVVDPTSYGSSSSSSSSSATQHTLQVDGSNATQTDYTFTVSGDLAEDATLGTIGTGDTISGSTATGFVNGGTDGYTFTGSLTALQLDGTAVVKVDGSPLLSNTIDVSGGSSGNLVGYSFTVSGFVNQIDDPGEDTVSGSTVTGAVNGGHDTYAFSGDVTAWSADGPLTVSLNGSAVDPSTLG